MSYHLPIVLQEAPDKKRRTELKWVAGALGLAGVAIAVAIGLDDTRLSPYQLELWTLIAQSAAGLAVIGGGARYLYERKRELAWDKTRFILDLFTLFDDDADFRRARILIDVALDTGDESYLETITGPVRGMEQHEFVDRVALDRYMDFFDRLFTHLYITKTLSSEDTSSFWGYAIDMSQIGCVRRFALEWGYEDVLRLAQIFLDDAQRRDRLILKLGNRRVS